MSTKQLIEAYWLCVRAENRQGARAAVKWLESRVTDRMTLTNSCHRGTLANGWFQYDY